MPSFGVNSVSGESQPLPVTVWIQMTAPAPDALTKARFVIRMEPVGLVVMK